MFVVFSRRWVFGLLGLPALAAFARDRSEAGFVRAGQSGDKDAFRKLHEAYEAQVRVFVSRRVPRSDVDDVLQETWLAVWQSLQHVQGRIHFRQWTFSICYRKVQDYWRREYVRLGSGIAELKDEHRAYMPKEFEQVELRDSIESFWRSCSEEQREVLAMYYGDGLTLKEIAEVLGRNLNTVKYQFYRAHEVAAERLPPLDAGVK